MKNFVQKLNFRLRASETEVNARGRKKSKKRLENGSVAQWVRKGTNIFISCLTDRPTNVNVAADQRLLLHVSSCVQIGL